MWLLRPNLASRRSGRHSSVRIRFAVDDGDWLQSALLGIERAWLDSPNRPFGMDILKSIIAATVSPLDVGEAGVVVRAIEAITFGRNAVIEALEPALRTCWARLGRSSPRCSVHRSPRW